MGHFSILPDFVGVTGRADEMGLAMWRATKAAQQVCEALAQLDQALPTPTNLASAQKNAAVSAMDAKPVAHWEGPRFQRHLGAPRFFAYERRREGSKATRAYLTTCQTFPTLSPLTSPYLLSSA